MRAAVGLLTGLLLCMVMPALAQSGGQLLKVELKREVFSDHFFLVLQDGAGVGADPADAPKISDGFVSISSATSSGQRLSVDARPVPGAEQQEVSLVIKGYGPGIYQLRIDSEQLHARVVAVFLVDRYLQKRLPIGTDPLHYEFQLDSLSNEPHGLSRFSLLLNKPDPLPEYNPSARDLLAFPNPFREKISLKVKRHAAGSASIRLLDIRGKVWLQMKFQQVAVQDILEIPCNDLPPGIYLLEYKSGSKSKTLKIMKI